jgi:hypothetical protein
MRLRPSFSFLVVGAEDLHRHCGPMNLHTIVLSPDLLLETMNLLRYPSDRIMVMRGCCNDCEESDEGQ